MQIISKIKLLANLSLIATYRLRKKSKGKIIAYKKTYVNLHPSCKIIIKKGLLKLNTKRDYNDPFTTLLSIRKDARLIIHNNFRIHSGARISINSGATLELGSGYVNYSSKIDCFHKLVLEKTL